MGAEGQRGQEREEGDDCGAECGVVHGCVVSVGFMLQKYGILFASGNLSLLI